MVFISTSMVLILWNAGRFSESTRLTVSSLSSPSLSLPPFASPSTAKMPHFPVKSDFLFKWKWKVRLAWSFGFQELCVRGEAKGDEQLPLFRPALLQPCQPDRTPDEEHLQTSCRKTWRGLYNHVTLSVQSRDPVCTITWPCLYNHVTLFVQSRDLFFVQSRD